MGRYVERRYGVDSWMYVVLIVITLCVLSIQPLAVLQSGYYSTFSSYNVECIKTYTMTENRTTSKRVDVLIDGQTNTFRCDDSIYMGVYNSAEMYSVFQPGHKYRVSTVGIRRADWLLSLFPLVLEVREIQ